MRKSLELAKKYTTIRSVDKSLVLDQFGYFNDEIPEWLQVKRPPQTSHTPLFSALCERAESIGTVNLAWSGGVDSTLLLAVYKSLNIPVKPIVFTDVSQPTNEALVNYVSNNFDLTYTTTDEFLSGNEIVYTGAGADVLFNSDAQLPNSVLQFRWANGNVETVYKNVPIYDVTEDIDLVGYGNYLGVKIETNLDALRVMTVGCKFWHNAYNWGMPMKILGNRQTSFYDTPKFMDISFSQYFDRQCLDSAPKTEEKRLIKQIFGSDFGVEKN